MFVKQNDFLNIIILFFSSLALFIWGQMSQEVIGFDSRFYLFVQEMWRNGINWFPTTYHQPYPDYPATSIWLIYGLAKLFGKVNKLVAILPSAILASLTLIFTYLIGALYDKRYGLCAAFFLLLTVMFLKSARSISLDLYPTFLTTLCFYWLHAAGKKPSKQIWWIYLFLFLGFIFRGPIGLILPCGVICSYYLINIQIKEFLCLGFFAGILLFISSIILLSLAHWVGGQAFLFKVLNMEVLGRIDNPFLPRYFYFTASFTNYALAFPCAVIVLAASLLGAQQRIIYSDFLLKLLGWVGVILIGMSIPDDKKIRYILPMLPAVALIAAYPWLVLTTHTYLNSLRKLMIKLFLLLPSLFFLLTFFVYRYAHQHAFHFNINYIDVAVICIFIQALLILNFYLVPIQWRELGIIGLVTLNFILIYILMIEPMELYIERAHKLVVSVETKRHAYQAKLVFYKEKPDGLPIKYLINMPQPTQPLFVDRFNDLFSITTPAFFVTSQTYFNEQLKDFTAHFDLIAQDSLGHVPIVVFKRKTVA